MPSSHCLNAFVCLHANGLRALLSASAATCCSADCFGLIILLFTFSPRGALVIRPNQMGACSAANPAGVSLISDLWPLPRRSIHP
jgi:hypothetical protein